MKLRDCRIQQPGLLLPREMGGYQVLLAAPEWELAAVSEGVLARRDGMAWLVPWGRVLSCEVEEAAEVREPVPLSAPVAAVAGAKGGRRR